MPKVADYVLEPPHGVGYPPHLRLPRRRDQRLPRCARPRRRAIRRSSSRGTRRWAPSWRPPTRSSPARSAAAWPPPAAARSTCSTASTTPSSTTSRWSRSSGSRSGSRWARRFQQEIDPSCCSTTSRSTSDSSCTPPRRARLIDRALKVAHLQPDGRDDHLPGTCRRPTRSPRRRASTAPSTPASGSPSRGSIPPETELRKAAEILNAGQKVAMLVGQGAEEADRRGRAGRRAARRRRGQDPARAAGAARRPALRHRPDRAARLDGQLRADDASCDTLFMVGTSFPYAEWLPEEGQARGVEIDIDGRLHRHPLPDGGQPRRRRQGDAAALIPLLKRKEDRSWREKIEHEVAEWWRVLDDRAHDPADPINPQLVAHELSPRLPDGAILTADSGSGTNWWAQHLQDAPGDAGLAVGHARHDGPGHALRDQREVRLPRPAGDRLRRRRRVPDERDGRADHRQALLGPADRAEPDAGLLRLQQPGPQPGHLGAARRGRRPEVHGHAVHPRRPLRRVRPAARVRGHLRRRPRGRRRGLGPGAGRRPARACWSSRPTRRSRRSRRTSRSSWARSRRRRCSRATPRRTASSSRGPSRRCTSSPSRCKERAAGDGPSDRPAPRSTVPARTATSRFATGMAAVDDRQRRGPGAAPAPARHRRGALRPRLAGDVRQRLVELPPGAGRRRRAEDARRRRRDDAGLRTATGRRSPAGAAAPACRARRSTTPSSSTSPST